MIKKYTVLFFLCVSTICFSQKKVQVKEVKGVGFIAGDVSENQARQNAINDAKVNALKEAGIEEHINSYQTLFSSQNNKDFSQFFSSDIQSEMQGAVKSYTVKSENKIVNPKSKQVEYQVVIDAEVVKYETKPDINFDAIVEGIKGAYNNHDKLSFTVKTTKTCYINIFCITDKEATLMYPNALEPDKVIQFGKVHSFPLLPEKLDYELETMEKYKETNRLIFVFTKEPMTYINIKGENQNTDIEKIFTWIYSIMPDQRKVLYFPFEIVK